MLRGRGIPFLDNIFFCFLGFKVSKFQRLEVSNFQRFKGSKLQHYKWLSSKFSRGVRHTCPTFSRITILTFPQIIFSRNDLGSVLGLFGAS